jgi:L-lactate dehydrogenase
MAGVGSEIVLVDKNRKRAIAQAEDILHAVPFAHRVRVRDGDFSDLAGSRVVIVGAGVNQKPGESRLELLHRNAEVFAEVIPQIIAHASSAVLLIVTNPVDVMTHLATRFAAENGLPAGKVLGSGTTLDTARFRALLGRQVGVDPHHVHGYVIGEHGDSEVLTWSLATIGGMPLERICRLRGVNLDEHTRGQIDQQVRKAAYRIIEGKGATYYGIGAAVAHIVDMILDDHRAILTVSSWAPEIEGVKDVTVSLPRLVSGEGVLATFPPQLNEQESGDLRRSVEIVRKAIDELDHASERTPTRRRQKVFSEGSSLGGDGGLSP